MHHLRGRYGNGTCGEPPRTVLMKTPFKSEIFEREIFKEPILLGSRLIKIMSNIEKSENTMSILYNIFKGILSNRNASIEKQDY